jgi:hypothetical protein
MNAMRLKLFVAAVAVAACLFGARLTAFADDNKVKKDPGTFGALESVPPDVAKAKSLAWLKKATNNDAAKLQAFEAIWNRADRSVLDNVADTFALGNADANSVLTLVRSTNVPAPTKVPDILLDAKADPFLRANLGLAVARILSNRRAHEEALVVLMGIEPQQTIEPATYLFHRAVSEHALLKKDDAGKTIVRLIQDAVDSPERYKTVAALMLLDMQTWKKDLGNVARLMDNSGRRLELARTDEPTKKIQKEIIARLDELIKELENKAKPKPGSGDPKGGGGQPGDPQGGACPDGGQPGQGGAPGTNPSNQPPKAPAPDFFIGGQKGSGKVDFAQIKKDLDNWAKLPPAEQAKAKAQIDELINSLPAVHREAFERYFEEINNRAIGLPKN